MNNNIITAKEVSEQLLKNDTTLYFKRFPLGREIDYNEFSPSIENNNIHPISPYNMSVEDIYNKSLKTDLLQKSIESRKSDRLTDKRLFENENEIFDVETLKLEYSLSKRYLFDDNDKLSAKTNIDIIDIITSHNLYENKEWDVIDKFNDERFINLNRITYLNNAYVSNRNLIYLNRTRRLGELFSLIKSDELKLIDKESRPQIYMTSNGIRPDNTQYHKWNGLQIFDLDIKYSNAYTSLTDIDFKNIKNTFYNILKDFHWFAGIGFSSSGKGIHIYTKVTRPHHYFVNEEQNEELVKYWYRMSYVQKYSVIRYIMENICNIDNGSDEKHPVVDFAMAKISQGVRVAYDADFLINENFEDLVPIIGYYQPPVKDLPIQEWLLKYIENNKTFTLWSNQNKVAEDKQKGTYKEIIIDYGDTEVKANNPIAYNENINYIIRYNVCNTLATFFGEEGRKYAHTVLSSTQCKNVNEINGIYNCSLTTNKTPSQYGLTILSKSGFDVKLGDNSKKELLKKEKEELNILIQKGAEMKDTSEAFLKLHSDEYLGMFDDKICDELRSGKVNLIVSPPGTGKTEFVKKISNNESVLLVLPYISVIDAKVIKDKDLGDNFDVYYGESKVDDLKKGRSAVMTVDKFGRINIDDILYMYKYIIIDESHLLFTSSFRLEAMANALKNIKKVVTAGEFDDFSSKMILMTGTTTGEKTYFDYYNMLNTLKIEKQENRKKEIEFIICDNTQEMQANIAIQIVDAINNNKRVLYPTNSGDIQAHKLVGMVEYLLGRPLKWSYYKKSNSKSEMYESINDHATVGDYELILASNYLSVGIDIKDNLDFEIIYDSSFSAYEIEQFNCRLRNVDINSKIYIPLHNEKNEILPNILNNQKYSIEMTIQDRDTLRDYVDISMKKLELSMSYDPITNKVYTPGFRVENGQMIFKLEEHELSMFEERFIDTMQAPFFISQIIAEYGYDIKITEAEAISNINIKELIGIGLENAKIESELRNDRSILTFNWLIENDTYINSYGMEVPNLLQRIWKDNITIDEDSSLSEIEISESLIGEVEKIIVPDRRIFDEQLPIASRFISLYSPDTCKIIYNLCIRPKSGKINKSEIARYMKLMQFLKMEERGQIGIEIYTAIKYIYEYLDEFYDDLNHTTTNEEYDMRVQYCLELYLGKLNLKLRTMKMIQKYRDEIIELFNTLCKKVNTKNEMRLEFRLLPTPDSPIMLKKKEYQSIMLKMFEISDSNVSENNIKLRHINKDNETIINSIKELRKGKLNTNSISPF